MRLLTLLFLMGFSAFFEAQEIKLSKDLDGDKVADHVYLDVESNQFVCELSSQKFKKVFSEPFEEEADISLRATKNGFEIGVNYMRAGHSYQFRYERETKKIRLIGMDRYEFGPANNDGSGKSSVNLLTRQYTADWNYYDVQNEELVKIPTVKKKMDFPKIYFTSVGNVYENYLEKDVEYYRAEKDRLQNSTD